MKRLFLLCSLWFTLIGASAPLSLQADVKRNSLDLLDPVSITISVVNQSNHAITAHFPTADTYDIAVLNSQGKELWRWSAVHLSAQVLRTMVLPPGKTTLVTYVWDASLADQRSIAAGLYSVRVRLVDTTYRPGTSQALRFAIPLPIKAASELKLNTAATLSGTLRAKGTVMELVDATGSITLNKRIAMQDPSGTFIVRGFMVRENGQQYFRVDRWARAAENVAAVGIPTWLAGDFGGSHVAMHTNADGTGTMQFDCAHATIASIVPADDRHAAGVGTFIHEHGGPARAGETLLSEPVRYQFERNGKAVALTLTTLAGKPLGNYTAQQNAPAQLFRCL